MTGTTHVTTAVGADDHVAVVDLMSRYAHRLDDRRMDELLELFHSECVLVFDGTTYAGTAQIREWQKVISAQKPGCHMMSNPEVWRGDGVLRSVADFVLLKRPESSWTVLARGRWLDTFDETGERLTLATRDIVIY